MRAAVRACDGPVFIVDVELEEIVDIDPDEAVAWHGEPAGVALPRLVTSDAVGSTVVALLDRRPPLAVSHDAGLTWRETGGGLPGGRAVAISRQNPDLILYAARNRLHVSEDGGRFWRALPPELPVICAVRWLAPSPG